MKFRIKKCSILLLALPCLLIGCGDEDGGGSGTSGGNVPTYSFSGYVKIGNGDPVTNVTVTLLEQETGVTHSALTSDQGYWLIGGIQDKDYNYTIVPSLEGWGFTPQSYAMTLGRKDQANVNFTGVLIPTITLTSPQADEIYRYGESLGIQWTSVGEIGAVDILYGNAIRQYTFIDRNIPALPGQYNWTVPSSLDPGRYTIRLISTNGLAISESGSFIITTN